MLAVLAPRRKDPRERARVRAARSTPGPAARYGADEATSVGFRDGVDRASRDRVLGTNGETAMARANVEVAIACPADEVWSIIRDFGDLSWRGGVDGVTVEGKIRTVRSGGLEVDETEFARDESARTFTYGVTAMRGKTVMDRGNGKVVDLATMVDHHRARFEVVPDGDDGCVVHYQVELDDGFDQNLASGAAQYEAVLGRLKERLES
jgi:hypothetical protein